MSNQLQLLEDDVDDATILYENGKYRGSLTHAFNAVERLVDSFLAAKGIKVRDRFGRMVAIEHYLGSSMLSEFEGLFQSRKNGMYERGVVPKDAVERILNDFIPRLVKELNKKLDENERIDIGNVTFVASGDRI